MVGDPTLIFFFYHNDNLMDGHLKEGASWISMCVYALNWDKA